MSPCLRLALVSLLLTAAASARQPSPLPLVFEENLGQAPSPVRYLARSADANFFFQSRGLTISLPHASEPLRLTFSGSATPELLGEDLAEGTSNYFIGRDATKWHTNIRHFRKIRYRSVSPGIDAVFYASGTQLEFDLILQPSAKLDQLSFRLDGASSMKLRDGHLVIRIGDTELHLRKPFTYQLVHGKQRVVSAKYRLTGNEISFTVGPHSKHVPLIIDPVFDYATYLGGSGAEWAYSVATDSTGAIYVTGITQSTNFPVANAMQRSSAGGLGDIFITKFRPDSSGVQYSTYIGGSGAEGDTQGYVGGIAIDTSGNAYITGVTRSPDFPTTPNSFQPVFGTRDTCGSGPTGGPCADAFILKLNSTGTALVYSSFLGGANHDEAKALALDRAGNAYVTGITSSSDFPTTSNAFDRVLQYQDAFVSKISADGSHLLYSTLLGGSGYDLALAIAVDSHDRAHVAGMTESSDFPLRHPLDSTLDPPWDAFVARITPDGSDVELSTLLGGSGTQQVLGVALDTVGDIYLAGYTDSADFPIVSAFQPDYGGGGGNGFVTKLKADGSQLLYSTFFGGQDAISELDAIFVNDRGEAYVAGSGGNDFPVVTSTRAYGGAADAVLLKLTPDGSGVYYSSFFGGNGYDLASSIALDASGYVVIAGETLSTNVPTHWASPQRVFGGASDAFIARFSDTVVDAPILSAPKLINLGTAYVNQPSPPKSLRISNTGTRTLHVNSIATSSNVTASTDCIAVQPGVSCNLNTSITVTSGAPGIGTVTLYDDSPDSPQTFTVRASGSYGGDLEVVSLNAGTPSQSNGTMTVPFTATVRNNGPYDSDSITLRVSNNIGGTECTPCSVGTLIAGASTTVRFNRNPSTFGMLPVTVTVEAGSRSPDINHANDTKSVTVPVPIYTAGTSAIDFGSQPVNSTSTTRRIVFTGLGYGPFRLSFSLTGAFVQTNTCGTSNDDGCYIDLAFQPIANGLHIGSLTINETIVGTTQTVSVAGTGTIAPFLALSPTPLDFGTRMIGRSSTARSIVLTNGGSAPLQIVSITSTPEFLSTHNCPASLAPSSSCSVTLTFTPLSSGTRSGTLTIQDNAVGNPHNVSLVGTGTTTPLAISPPFADFGAQRLGVTSAPQTISLTNVGGTTIHVGSVSTPAGFQQTNNCGNIQPDNTCQLLLTFTPIVSGTVGGTVIIQDDGFGSPRSLSVSGSGVQPILSMDQNSLAFPSTRINAASATQFVTVMNTGNTSMLLQNVTVSGDFSVINGCGSLVPATGSCFLIVTFRPSASGTRNGEIVIADDAPASPHRVSLTGLGRAVAINLLPSSLNYPTQAVGASSAAQTIVITNDTSASISLISFVPSGDYSQTNNCPQQLAPDAICSINVVFSPRSAGTRNGTLTVVDSTGSHTVELTGTGAASAALITPSSIVFTPTLLGGSATQEITINSIGTAPLSIGAPTISGIGFSYVSSCPSSLAVGRSCSVTVRFTPSSLGLSQGWVKLFDDAPGSPRTISLSGTGLQISINTGRPQRSNRNTPAVKPTESRGSLRRMSATAQPSSADAVLRAFSTSANLVLEDHDGTDSAGSGGSPEALPREAVPSQLDPFCGSAAAGYRRRLAATDVEIPLAPDQQIAVLRGDIGSPLVTNDIEFRGSLVERLDFKATRFQFEPGSGCDRDLPADQLREITTIADPAPPQHPKRSARQ